MDKDGSYHPTHSSGLINEATPKHIDHLITMISAKVQEMYGPWPTDLLSPSCKYYNLFNIYTLFYIQL